MVRRSAKRKVVGLLKENFYVFYKRIVEIHACPEEVLAASSCIDDGSIRRDHFFDSRIGNRPVCIHIILN